MIKFKKLKIHSSVFFFFLIMILLGRTEQFLILMLVTTLHELSHGLVAKYLGYRLEQFIIMPIGEVAYIEGLDWASAADRIKIVLAGPVFNLACGLALGLCPFEKPEWVLMFQYISLSIGIFNLLPIYPLDGGKLAFLFLGNSMGILRSREIVGNFTAIGIAMLFALGLLQVVLQPFNITLVAIAAFVLSIYRRESAAMYLSYFRCMLHKEDKIAQGRRIRPVLYFSDSEPVEVQKTFTWSNYHLISVMEDDKIIGMLTEGEVFSSILAGKSQTLGELLQAPRQECSEPRDEVPIAVLEGMLKRRGERGGWRRR